MMDQHPPGSTQTETTGPVLQKETRHSSDDLLPLEPGVGKVLDQPKNQELHGLSPPDSITDEKFMAEVEWEEIAVTLDYASWTRWM